MSFENPITLTNQNINSGYKVVEVNVSYPSENVYAVCTPVKKQS